MKRRKYKRCSISGKRILATELDAKIALASCIRRDSGEIRYFPCRGHFHLTSEDADPGRNKRSA